MRIFIKMEEEITLYEIVMILEGPLINQEAKKELHNFHVLWGQVRYRYLDVNKKTMLPSGFEPESLAWEAKMLNRTTL